jgi:hypothetical protein
MYKQSYTKDKSDNTIYTVVIYAGFAKVVVTSESFVKAVEKALRLSDSTGFHLPRDVILRSHTNDTGCDSTFTYQ